MGGAQISNASITGRLFPLAGKTIINKYMFAVDGTSVVHTVPANKTFYLTAALLGYRAEVGTQAATLDAGGEPSLILRLLTKYTATYYTQDNGCIGQAFPFPVPYPQNTNFQLTSTHADVYAYAKVIGWEE